MALLPEISVYFSSQAKTIVERSERGNVILIIRDTHAEDIGIKTYKSTSEVTADASDYDADNLTAIKDVLYFNPYKVYVIAIASNAAVSTALDQIRDTVKTGWITVAGITTADSTAIAEWVKEQEDEGRSYKAVVYDTAADCKHVVNFVNTAVEFTDGRTAEASTYTPSLAAIFAVCNIKRGSTNYLCSNLESVTEPSNVSIAVESGKLVLINDDDGYVRIAEGVNSLTTLGTDDAEDMKLIEVVEGMDLIYEDIVYAFRNNFMGQYKNTRGNQYKFISDVNSYFASLVQIGLLSDTSDNKCDIDTDAQRAAWEAYGTDTTDWSDEEIKNHPLKRTMFITGTVTMLQSIESLMFGITLN